MVSPAALPSARARCPDRPRRPPARSPLEPPGPRHRPAQPPGVGERSPRARGDAARRRARRAPGATVRARARNLGRATRSRHDRERARSRHGTPGDQPLRRHAGADAADARRPRHPRRRSSRRRLALLHVPVDAGPRHACVRARRRRRNRARPAEPARRRRRRGQRAGPRVRVVRRSLSAAGASRPHAWRAGDVVPSRARPAPRADGRADAWLAPRDAVGGHRRAVGGAVAEHADARHRARLSGRLPDRRHQSLGRARDDAAVRVGSARPTSTRTRTPTRWRASGCPASPSVPRASRRPSTSGRDDSAVACRST